MGRLSEILASCIKTGICDEKIWAIIEVAAWMDTRTVE
jgi:hypothetical protein